MVVIIIFLAFKSVHFELSQYQSSVKTMDDFFSLYLFIYFFNKWQSEMDASSSSISDVSSTKSCDTHLLTCGRAWAISLSLRSTIGQEILRVCFPSNEERSEESLLYRFVFFSFVV